jgi:hypothetical protein
VIYENPSVSDIPDKFMKRERERKKVLSLNFVILGQKKKKCVRNANFPSFGRGGSAIVDSVLRGA